MPYINNIQQAAHKFRADNWQEMNPMFLYQGGIGLREPGGTEPADAATSQYLDG